MDLVEEVAEEVPVLVPLEREIQAGMIMRFGIAAPLYRHRRAELFTFLLFLISLFGPVGRSLQHLDYLLWPRSRLLHPLFLLLLPLPLLLLL
jgi:hypothetical protein